MEYENCNKKYKYISTLLHPELSKYGKIPNSVSTKTTIFKKRRQLEYTTNSNGNISIQWTPQALYLTNDGIFVYNNAGYTGISAGTPTTTGLGIESSGFVTTGRPIRLVAASMIIIYGGSTANQGILTCGTYETSISTNTPDNNMSIFSQINNLQNIKTVKASDGIKIIYIPFDITCSNFYKLNTNLGKDGTLGNGMLNTQRFVFYGTEMTPSSTCLQITYTQIFESTLSNDYFNLTSNSFYCNNISSIIRDEIINKGRTIFKLSDDNIINDDIKNKIIKKKKIKKFKINKCFFYPDKITSLRLPSFYGETTTLFDQISTINITPNSNGFFLLQFYPQYFHTNGNSSQTGLYLANNSTFDGLSNAIVTSLTDLDFTLYSQPIFNSIRLVSCSIKVLYSGIRLNASGCIISGINLEQPPFTIPSNTNYNYRYIESLPKNKTICSFDGTKIIYVPYDYSCMSFIPPDFLNSTNNNNSTMSQAIYICGYSLPNTSCIKIIINRLFEGIPNTYVNDYFMLKSSNIGMDECRELTDNIINNDLLITKISDEDKILNILNKNI